MLYSVVMKREVRWDYVRGAWEVDCFVVVDGRCSEELQIGDGRDDKRVL
jgi:hypothetical protein